MKADKELTKMRREVLSLAENLKPLSQHLQIKMMLETARKEKYPRFLTKVWNCGKHEYDHVMKPLCSEWVYATVIDRCEDWNVVRTFAIHHKYYKTKANIHSHPIEVKQTWIASDGKSVIRERNLKMFHQYCELPYTIYNPELKFKNSYHSCWENHLYLRSCTPELRRRGLKTSTHNINPSHIITGLLTDPRIETAWKAQQYEHIQFYYYKYMVANDSKLFFEAIKIANRHNYKITDLSMWYDMIKALRELEKDTHSPHYVCPQDLKQAHDKVMLLLNRKHEKERLAKLIADTKMHEDEYKKRIGKYMDITLSNDNVDVFVCPSVAAMADEGQKMHHCVYACGYYKAEHNCLILFVRDKEGNRISTVELGTKEWKVRQNRGLQNSVPQFKDEVNNLIKSNIKLFKQASKTKPVKPTVTNHQISIAA